MFARLRRTPHTRKTYSGHRKCTIRQVSKSARGSNIKSLRVQFTITRRIKCWCLLASRARTLEYGPSNLPMCLVIFLPTIRVFLQIFRPQALRPDVNLPQAIKATIDGLHSLHVRPFIKPPAPHSPFRRLCVKARERQFTSTSFLSKPPFCPSHHASSFPNPFSHHLHGYDETKQHPTACPFRQAVFMSILYGAL